jgi:pimeloyl-ACP methyl ester carboxylesterase
MMKPFVWLACIGVLVTGCVGQRQYRSIDKSVRYEALQARQFDPRQNADTVLYPYHLAFIEFDERGEFFDRRQLDSALATISKARDRAATLTRTQPPDSAPVRPTVVLFVHGWKHNASDKSANVWGFRQLLAGFSLQTKAPVVGIYVGWRGLTLTPPILKELTFFDRHQKSQALPNAHLVESLTSIMSAAKVVRAQGEPTATMVLFGHSFGGAVLESALTQTFAGLVANAADVRKITWPADLIVYVNQAQEADRSYQLIEAMHTKGSPRDTVSSCRSPTSTTDPDVPVMVSISSTGDYATGAAFPVGKAFLRPFQKLREYKQPNFLGFKGQGRMFFNPTAHLSEFHSHFIGRVEDPKIQDALRQCHEYLRWRVLGGEYAVVEKPGAANRTPYWVMSMPPSIVPDHGTIFTPVFRNLLVGFLEAARLYAK